jgi:hypothetical protein
MVSDTNFPVGDSNITDSEIITGEIQVSDSSVGAIVAIMGRLKCRY